MAASDRSYVLGNDPQELQRLDRQAANIERPTRVLMQSAGIRPGMRVLDLGTGLGHVARIAAELVGPGGSVVGIDESGDALAVARSRAAADGVANLSFVEADVRHWAAEEPFDAVVGRLILFHLADPVAAVRHQLRQLRGNGIFVAVDFDLGGARAEPAVPLVAEVLGWVVRAFEAAGASPRIGARLAPILRNAGLRDVVTMGIQGYLAPGDRAAAQLLGGVTRTLGPAIVGHGIATDAQLDLPTLEDRIHDALTKADAVLLPPTVTGAWGRVQDVSAEA
jgi:ubiquinone/menaquinone biosynthesis C-methylase UbiE